MHLRRFTRLTNAYGKTLANMKDAVALYVAFYNFLEILALAASNMPSKRNHPAATNGWRLAADALRPASPPHEPRAGNGDSNGTLFETSLGCNQ
jgi:hypothetical protein